MYKLIFSKLPHESSYNIIDNNDERLYLMALFLLNNKVRSKIKEQLLSGFSLKSTNKN